MTENNRNPRTVGEEQEPCNFCDHQFTDEDQLRCNACGRRRGNAVKCFQCPADAEYKVHGFDVCETCAAEIQ